MTNILVDQVEEKGGQDSRPLNAKWVISYMFFPANHIGWQ